MFSLCSAFVKVLPPVTKTSDIILQNINFQVSVDSGNEECTINRDLKVYILQDNVSGPRDRREYFEDRWITRLDTKALHTTEFGCNLIDAVEGFGYVFTSKGKFVHKIFHKICKQQCRSKS